MQPDQAKRTAAERRVDEMIAAARRHQRLRKLLPWLIMAGTILVWEIACHVFAVPDFILPAPSIIAQSMIKWWDPILDNAGQTLMTTLAGFGIAIVFGVLLGGLIGSSSLAYDGLYPLLIAFNSVPKVAVVPILVIWFGIGTIPAVITAFLISFFPIVVNVATGLSTIEPELEDVLRALGAKKLDIMLKIGIPRTQPYLFGALKVAITLAFVGTVVSETIAANAGLGFLMVQAGSNFQMPLVFAGLLLLGAEGIIMYAIFAYVESYFVGWAFRSSMSAGG